jgi:serine/threonine protein kinase
MTCESIDMGYLGMPSDCWSCGIILFIMLCGRHPFDEGPGRESSDDWIEDSKDCDAGSYEEKDEEEDGLCPQMSLDTEKHIKRRIVAGLLDFREPEWDIMSQAKSLLSHLLSPDPQKRAKVDEASAHPWLTQESEELECEYRISVLGHIGRRSGKPAETA